MFKVIKTKLVQQRTRKYKKEIKKYKEEAIRNATTGFYDKLKRIGLIAHLT